METTESSSLINKLSKIYLKSPRPFTKKRDINWRALNISAAAGVAGLVVVLLLLPTQPQETTVFNEKVDSSGNKMQSMTESNPTTDAWSQLQQAQASVGAVPRSFDYLSPGQGRQGGSGNAPDRNSSMILSRSGLDAKTQLPPGTKIKVKTNDAFTLSTQAVPVIGIVVSDLEYEGTIAIPRGSKVIGEISFDESSERAAISFRTIQMPDGRERQISAVGIGNDGQYGINGKIKSEAFKNTMGQTITRFIGAYAEGSMQRGPMGSSQGGEENGMKNAVAQTAKDRAESWAEDLKKEKKWIEIPAGKEFSAVINQPFPFRDPGGFYGR